MSNPSDDTPSPGVKTVLIECIRDDGVADILTLQKDPGKEWVLSGMNPDRFIASFYTWEDATAFLGSRQGLALFKHQTWHNA